MVESCRHAFAGTNPAARATLTSRDSRRASVFAVAVPSGVIG